MRSGRSSMAVETKLSISPERICFDDDGELSGRNFRRKCEVRIQFSSLSELRSDFCHGDPLFKRVTLLV